MGHVALGLGSSDTGAMKQTDVTALSLTHLPSSYHICYSVIVPLCVENEEGVVFAVLAGRWLCNALAILGEGLARAAPSLSAAIDLGLIFAV